MAMRDSVAQWRALADAAEREYPGWWRHMDDQLRSGRARHLTSSARLSVASLVAASHEAVPAMAEALEEAAAVLAAWRAADTPTAAAAAAATADAWLSDWSGE